MSDGAPWEADAPVAAATPAADADSAPWMADAAVMDTPPAGSSTPSGPDETPSRVAELGARALGTGAAGTLGTVSAAINPIGTLATKAYDTAQSYLHPSAPPSGPYTPQLSDFVHPERWQQAAEFFADKAGAPKPETAPERVGYKAVQALPSAVMAPEAPIAAGLAAAAGGAGQQTAAEMGYGPVGQTIAGLAAGSLPAIGSVAAAGVRGIVRGGAEGQAAMQGRLADAAASGTNLSAGQAGGSTLTQYLEGISSKGWGGGSITKSAEAQTKNIGSYVDSIVNNLSGGVDVSPMTAGAAVEKGIGNAQTPGTAFGNMRAAEKAAYGQVDALVPADHPIDVSGTLGKLNELASPTPGAPASTAALISPKIAKMRDDLQADIAANGGKPVLPYEAASALKTAVGNNVDWGFAPSDPVANGALKQIHTALKSDIDTGAAAASDEASQAVTQARSLYAQNQQTREALYPIIDRAGGPEAVYQAATNGTKQGATKIGQVMTAINPDQQNLVRATVLDKLGRASGAQGAPFNANTFLTNWNKIDPTAKDALFGASGTPGALRSNLDSLTNTISNISTGTRLRNPSGSGEVVGHGAGAIALWGGLTNALAGHPATLAGIIGGVAANNLMARALTNPKTVAWLARSTEAPMSALPNAINQLSQLGKSDPDAHALATYFAQGQPEPSDAISRASGGKVDEDALVERLMTRWRSAKKATDASTAPLLKVPDAAIAAALRVSGRGI